MPYIPKYLELLSRSGTPDGWPQKIDEAGKEFAVDCIRKGFEKYGVMDLGLAQECIYNGLVTDAPVPECLKGKLWDWLFAVTYRALLAADAEKVYRPKQR